MAVFSIRRCAHCGKPYGHDGTPRKFCSDSCRFWSGVDISDDDAECWEWGRSLNQRGYGNYPSAQTEDGKSFHSAHRAAYHYAYGEIPDDKQVLHHCDNRKCCNPHHLYLGGYFENNRDKAERFRAGKKLTLDAVRAIKQDDRPPSEVAASFGVSVSLIWLIRKGRIWKTA